MNRFKLSLSPDYIREEAKSGTAVVETIDLEAGATALVYELGQLACGAVFTQRGRTLRYTFDSRTVAEKWAARELERLKLHAAQKRARRAERAAFSTALQVGDVLVSSWGYEQTNVNYYEVTAVIGRVTVELRPIAQQVVETKGPMSETVAPAVGQYIGAPKRYRVCDGDIVKVSSSQHARKWDGRPEYQSHYA